MNIRLGFSLLLAVPTVVFFGGCDRASLPPCEILYSVGGLLLPDTNGQLRFVESTTIPLSEGREYGWLMQLRTNKSEVTFKEEIRLAGPATWNEESDAFSVARDKKSAVRTRKLKLNRGQISGFWSVSGTDPLGPVEIHVSLEGGPAKSFHWTLTPPANSH